MGHIYNYKFNINMKQFIKSLVKQNIITLILYVFRDFLVRIRLANFKNFISGKLTDTLGVPINGDVDMTFTLYDSDGTQVWQETFNGDNQVTITYGHFSVQLGSIVALDETVFNTDNLTLGVKVDDDDEMTPVKLTHEPFCISSCEFRSIRYIR